MIPPDVEPVSGAPDPGPGPNRALEPLSPLKARSTVAAILAFLALVSPLLGGGIGEVVAEIAAASDLILQQTERAVNAFNALLGVAGLLWLWWERRAPHKRLSFRRR